jgi:hypothetical protein
MRDIFLQIYAAAFFVAAMFAIQAAVMPMWGPFAIGGAAWMLANIWLKSLPPNKG